MFIMGIELDAAVMKKKARQSLIISVASILLPFAGGFALALNMYGRYAASGAGYTGFAIFMGIAMSVTAFPFSGAFCANAAWNELHWACLL
jgi:Kef-type K+ transport system membrane component KefB